MYVRRRIRWSLIWQFAWRNLLIFTAWSTAVTAGFVFLEPYAIHMGIPFAPISTIGTAVALYVGFKNSQSYDRLWEARKLWGGIVNTSRTWTVQVLGFADSKTEAAHVLHTRLVHRQIAWVHALRMQLRRTTIFDRSNLTYTPDLQLRREEDTDRTVESLLADHEYERVLGLSNPAAQILRLQTEDLHRLRDERVLGEMQHVSLMETIRQLYELQGACERIKNTPFPRQYAYFSSVFVRIFTFILPFGLVPAFHEPGAGNVWLTVPFSVLISWIFATMEIVGDNSEDPFENYVNDVPMTALSRSIEIDLREMLGEKTIPPRLLPVRDILM